MKVDAWYPAPKDILKCEVETLRFLRDKSQYYPEFSKLAADAYRYCTQIKSDRRLKFAFESEFQVYIGRKEGTALIGANIVIADESTYEGISYYVAICNNDTPHARLLRKYHFDYASQAQSRRQPHPVFHLQYAGELSKHLEQLDLKHEHIDSWLSEPRLHFSPMSLALLINLILKEFPCETNQKFIELREWRDLMRGNEKLLLAPYYKACHQFLSNRPKGQLFINDFYYTN